MARPKKTIIKEFVISEPVTKKEHRQPDESDYQYVLRIYGQDVLRMYQLFRFSYNLTHEETLNKVLFKA